jgi:PAS domain S-box-containing protein
MVRSALDAIVMIDAAGLTVEFNPAAEQLFGWSRADVIGREMAAIIVPPRMRTRHREGLARFLATREPAILGRRLEMPALRSDGTEIPVELTVVQVEFDDPAAPPMFTATLRDATAQRDAALQAARLAAIVASSRDGIIGLTLDGTIDTWNRGAEAIYGYTAADIVGRNIRTLAPPERLAELEEFHARVLRGEAITNHETVRTTRDGRFIDVSLSLSPILGPDGVIVGISTFVRDITSSKALEARLLTAQRLENVGVLAGGIAHEFNNILQAVGGHAEMILTDLAGRTDGEPDLPAIQTAAEAMRTSAKRAADLTQQLLAFSRQQFLTPKVVDAREAVRDLEPLLQPLVGEDIKLVLDLDPGTSRIRVDAAQFDAVLVSLVANARDAMPGGGTVTIQTANRTISAASPGEVADVPAGSYVVVAISDTGLGMDQTTRDHIFEPFFTTKQQGKGTGLGLSATYGVVHQSGGYVTVTSEPGKGASFRLHFPIVDEAIGREAPHNGATGSAAGTVLVVDDEPSVRQLAVRILERAGFAVVAADEARSALETVQALPGSIIALVTDVVMPGMSGPELARAILRDHPGIGVVLMSGYLPGTLDISDLLAGGARFVAKPFAPVALIDALGEAVAAS